MTSYNQTIISVETALDVREVRKFYLDNYDLIKHLIETGTSASLIVRACARALHISPDRVRSALDVIKSE